MNNIDDLRFIAENGLQPLVRISVWAALAVMTFVFALATIGMGVTTWLFLLSTILFVKCHYDWVFGKERIKQNRMSHEY